MSRDAVIVDALRTPMGRGKADGALAAHHPTELLAEVFKALLARNGVDPGQVDDVIVGCVSQVGEQSATPGRVAWLAAGLPEHVPATTIDRKCGSSQQAVHFAAQGIMAGAYDMVVVGGVESMSHVPMGSARMGMNPFGPSYLARYAPGPVSQGESAELLAAEWGLKRVDLDAYALASHQRAARFRDAGHFQAEILPIRVGETLIDSDETIRPNTSLERLASLPLAFENAQFKKRFPQIDWCVTAGNSSQITDGASALLVMSADRARELGLRPRARFAGFDVCGDSPLTMLAAPIPATRRLLKKTGISLNQISHFEVNEAFASVPLAWQRAFDVDSARLNPCGGAIALGHPLGASGARLMTTMLHALERTGGRYGLQTMCEAGGMANATLIERI